MTLPVHWTPEQAIALAPDESSAKAAQTLSSPRKWRHVARSDAAMWGEIQGSGAEPYRTCVDGKELAFHCTCPSRKIPCKHSIGLLLLFAKDPAASTNTPPPEWVSAWIASRAARAARASSTARSQASPSESSSSRSRRKDAREARVRAGLEELGLWLRDIVREGLAALPGKPRSAFEGAAARLVDAQAPGAARKVRQLAGVPYSGEGWEARFLEQAARLHLLAEGYRRLESLPAALQEDLRAAAGWTTPAEVVLGGERIADAWSVLGASIEEEDRLFAHRAWLRGRRSGQWALLLSFTPRGGAMEAGWIPGMEVDAELAFFPGSVKLRALEAKREGAPRPIPERPAGDDSLLTATERPARDFGRNPWLDRAPVLLREVIPIRAHDGSWRLRDRARQELGISSRFQYPWELLALSGGRPVDVCCEWDGDALCPLSVLGEPDSGATTGAERWVGGVRLVPLSTGSPV